MKDRICISGVHAFAFSGGDLGKANIPVPRDLVDRVASALATTPAVLEGEDAEIYEEYAQDWGRLKGYTVAADLDFLHCSLLWLQHNGDAVHLEEDLEILIARHDKADGKQADLTPPPAEGNRAKCKIGMQETPTPQAVFKGHAQKLADSWLKKPSDPEEAMWSASLLLGEFHKLALLIADHCGDGGPTTHALNRLRECQMWALHALDGQEQPVKQPGGYLFVGEGAAEACEEVRKVLSNHQVPCPQCGTRSMEHKMSCTQGLVFTDE